MGGGGSAFLFGFLIQTHSSHPKTTSTKIRCSVTVMSDWLQLWRHLCYFLIFIYTAIALLQLLNRCCRVVIIKGGSGLLSVIKRLSGKNKCKAVCKYVVCLPFIFRWSRLIFAWSASPGTLLTKSFSRRNLENCLIKGVQRSAARPQPLHKRALSRRRRKWLGAFTWITRTRGSINTPDDWLWQTQTQQQWSPCCCSRCCLTLELCRCRRGSTTSGF